MSLIVSINNCHYKLAWNYQANYASLNKQIQDENFLGGGPVLWLS